MTKSLLAEMIPARGLENMLLVVVVVVVVVVVGVVRKNLKK
jgi:hypothetical protein